MLSSTNTIIGIIQMTKYIFFALYTLWLSYDKIEVRPKVRQTSVITADLTQANKIQIGQPTLGIKNLTGKLAEGKSTRRP